MIIFHPVIIICVLIVGLFLIGIVQVKGYKYAFKIFLIAPITIVLMLYALATIVFLPGVIECKIREPIRSETCTNLQKTVRDLSFGLIDINIKEPK